MPKLGYLLPTRERVMEGHHETGFLLALAEKAEGMGFDSIWVGDSLTARPRHDPLTLLAAVAARTRKAELGTAVLLPALRNPVLLAHQVATLDRLCEGRLILGIGIAADTPSIRRDFEAAGVPFDKRVGRMNDAMRLCRALWTGQPVDWQGYWTVKQATVGPTPHRPGGPPIWIGGSSGPALRRAADRGDGWLPQGPPKDGMRAGIEAILRRREETRPGEPIDLGINAEPVYLGEPTFEVESWTLTGSSDHVAERLRRYRKLGVNHMQLRFRSRSVDELVDQIEQFGREVAPQLDG